MAISAKNKSLITGSGKCVLWQAGRLAGRAADPHRPHHCEVANSVAFFRELSWLTRRIAEVKLDRKAVGLRLAYLPRLRTATGLDLLD